MTPIYYHNPRCSKSREGLELITQSGMAFQVKEYLKEPLTKMELERLFKKLGPSASGIIRKKEPIYKDLNLKDKVLSQTEEIQMILENPILLERPILETHDQALIGRPPENFKKILKDTM